MPTDYGRRRRAHRGRVVGGPINTGSYCIVVRGEIQ